MEGGAANVDGRLSIGDKLVAVRTAIHVSFSFLARVFILSPLVMFKHTKQNSILVMFGSGGGSN